MATQRVEAELLSATKVKSEGQDRQALLTELVQAAANLEDADYGPLSKAAKDWIKQATNAYNLDKPLPDFGAKDTQPDEAAETSDSEETMKKKVKTKKKATTKVTSKSTAKPAKKAKTGYKHPKAGVKRGKMASEVRLGQKAGSGAPTVIKKLCLSHPDWKNEDIMEALKKKGVKVTLPSIRSVRSGFRNSVLVLLEAGLLKGKEIRV